MTVVDVLKYRCPGDKETLMILEDWADIFALIVVYSDGYYRLKPSKACLNQVRFFNMMQYLPLTHQMIVVSYLLDMDVKDGFPVVHLKDSLDSLVI